MKTAAEETVRLPEIVVEASPVDQYLPATTRVEREEIVESRKSDLGDVLDLTPGLNVRIGGRGESRLDVRGFDQRATLFTLNGVPVYEPWNGVVNLDLFPIEMLGSIEVVRGPSSALYGPNGMAGTVKMSTFAPRQPLSGTAAATWRYDDFWEVRAGGGAQRGRLSALLGGRFLTSPDFTLSEEFDDRPATRRRFENGGRRLNSDREDRSLFANAGYETVAGGRVHAALLVSDSEFGIPPSTTGFAPQFRRTDGQQLYHAQVGAEHLAMRSVTAGGAVFYSAYSTTESVFAGPDFDDKLFDTTADSDEIGGIGRLTFALGERDTFILGGLVRRAKADVSDSVSGALADPDVVTTSAAAENVYALTERIALIVGLSADIQTGGGRGTDWELSPQGGVSFNAGRFGVARVAVGRKIRFPTLRELFDPLQGNENLHAEEALTYEIGHRLASDDAYFDVALFRSEVEDLIESEGGGSPEPAMNLEEAVLQGVEVAFGAAPIRAGRLDVNYTFLDAEASDKSATGSSDFFDIQHRPEHRLNGILRFFLPWDVLIRLEGLYASEQVESFGTDVEIDDFALFNVQVARPFTPNLDVFAGVDNLLDEDYEEKLGTPRPGRRAYAGLRATY